MGEIMDIIASLMLFVTFLKEAVTKGDWSIQSPWSQQIFHSTAR